MISKELESLMDKKWFTNLANFSALVMERVPKLNWVGFYLDTGHELLLGPFQGRPACLKIAYGKGVCGTAYQKKETIIVPDVDRFDGHIACDSASKSELVIPLMVGGRAIGVLDVDAPVVNRFSADDAKLFQNLVEILIKKTEWPQAF